MEKIKGFKWRGMFTFLVVLALVVDAVSGIILYITPPGRIAHWGNWTLWGLNKGGWQAIHTVFSLLLLLVIVGHLYFNWRVLVHFFWSKIQNAMNLKWELAVATVIIILVFVGTLWNVQPFKSVMTLGRDLKLSWAEGNGSYPGFGRGRGAAMNSRRSHDSRWQGEGGRISRTIHTETAPFGEGRKGFGRRALGQNAPMQSETRPYRAGGQGFGKRAYAPMPAEAPAAERLKGRDIVRLGKPETLKGILVRQRDEWALTVDKTAYEIHMGPAEFRTHKGFTLTEGEEATVSGFLYGKDLAVTTMETNGKSIVLRDDTGRSLWAGTSYGRGAGRGRMNRL
ncbi:MAG: DUF4405 domain-containing protein [Deltaproteobacteria bacterium]|nr:DUF4405 domain-containing protein [Deltaproteobacteria bacterium]